jgi:hypothetical protein
MKIPIDQLDEHSQKRIEAAALELFPRVLPPRWRQFEDYANAGWWIRDDGLKVCCEVESQDGKLWLHVSLSRAESDPSYLDMTQVKALFVGAGRKAIMVLPERENHYNFHAHCLHMWTPLEGDPLPDFRREDGAL